MKAVPTRFHKAVDGEWQQPVESSYFMKCCDCGLVHRMNFRVVGGRAQFQAFRAIVPVVKRAKRGRKK